jgi:ATP-binding cassette, subfamily F, member 3
MLVARALKNSQLPAAKGMLFRGQDTSFMLTVSQLSKSFAGRVLFEDAALQVNKGDRVALIGPNGAGKTTLLSILLGLEIPDKGEVVLQRGAVVGYLPQELALAGDQTVMQIAISPIRGPGSGNDDGLAADVYQREAKAKRILRGLSFRETNFYRAASTLSGGWIMRAYLARLLVAEPDLLLLDEPTNHLDLESLLWFQEYLWDYPGAILAISHDRSFLNRLADHIVEIDRQKLVRYRGNYDDFVVQKNARQEQQSAAYRNQQREIKRLQTFIDRFGAKNTKASQAQSKRKQIERLDLIDAPDSVQAQVSFRFPRPRRSGLKAIELTGVSHAYGENVVYEGVHYTVERDQRTVLVGPNGAGKSTLLKLLGGVLPVQRGTRQPGYNAQIGYFSQHRVEMLGLDHSVLDEAAEIGMPEQRVRSVLGAFLFRGNDVFKPVCVLSGGEKSRLALAKLLLDPPNCLLMDEPTTHLDMASIEALIQALRQYEGSLLFVSHDVYFIRSIATSVLHILGGKLKFYPGDYDYYLEKSEAASDRAGLTAGDGLGENVREMRTSFDGRERKRLEAEERQTRSKTKKELEKKLSTLECRILDLEGRQKELVGLLEGQQGAENGSSAVEINAELRTIINELTSLSTEWDRLVEAAQLL